MISVFNAFKSLRTVLENHEATQASEPTPAPRTSLTQRRTANHWATEQ